ncbi:MAG: hypothetical protein FWG83_02050 [Oscillospiraceae bacterium]|nr:hypothetical protein [Oscillospiraceae bacterium]
MIKTRLRGVEIGADFTFFAVLAMFLSLDSTGFAIMSLSVCLIHEAGHLAAMLFTKKKPKSIVFSGGGVRITVSGRQSLSVIVAGSAVNIGLFFLLYFTLPKNALYPVMFAVLNLVTGVFNLLPIGCLDGKRLLSIFLPERPLAVIETVVTLLTVIVIAAAFFEGYINFTIVGAIIYIMAVDFFSGV